MNDGNLDRALLAWERYSDWMRQSALPFWSTQGLARDGGVVERLTMDAAPDRPGFKRVRVHARQAYVFSHAWHLGHADMAGPARAAIEFLDAHGRNEWGGWVVKMGEAGGIVDAEVDLYDQAFVILALSWWYKVSGEQWALDRARQTRDLVEQRFLRPDGAGYLSRLPNSGEALQNPHMHLFEALLALQETAPDHPTRRMLLRLRRVFDDHLFDGTTGTLGEVFAMDWQPAAGEAGQIVEPGHHYEWVWLLHMAKTAGIGAAQPAADQLFQFAEAHGVVASTSRIHDRLTRIGKPMSKAHRSWPQTERLKALVVRGERAGTWDHGAIADGLEALWRDYLSPAPPGTWIDHVDGDGVATVETIPASTLYHLFLAYAEIGRCAPSMFAGTQRRKMR